ncbi:integrase, catalytic region, zinc finger, CCHC-type containing protein [Tanacetum coccineum]
MKPKADIGVFYWLFGNIKRFSIYIPSTKRDYGYYTMSQFDSLTSIAVLKHDCLEPELQRIFSSLPPLIIYEAVRMFIAFAAHMNITIFQMDVKTAFLNGHLKEEVYVSQPEGFIDLNSQITSTVLKKSSIRLKQHLMPCLLKKHGLDECSPHEPTYATERLDADLQGTPTDQTTYRRMIGGLMYLTTSRPDIAFVAFVCARYQARPTLQFKKTSRGGKLMSWSSKKQDCTAMSTAEAEYVSLSACCAQVNRMLPPTSLTMDLNTNQILMYYDSKSAIARFMQSNSRH